MRTNSKGYSLVELVMTLGCFSIIMLAIMLMMRTTIATYKDGLLETRKQQEAQIVANQVADLIVDAKLYMGENGTGNYYKFKTAENAEKVFVLDSATKTLYFDTPAAISSGYGTPLSDCVTGFKIEGLRSAGIDKLGLGTGIYGAKAYSDSDVKKTEYDNTCRVHIKINYLGREYEAVKDVHFRNDIENPQQYNVAMDDSATPGPTPGGAKEVVVLRYETINLTKKFDIVNYSIPAGSNVSSWYTLTPTASINSSFIKSTGITIKCNNVVNGDFSKTLNTSSNCVLDCTTRSGGTMQLIFTTESVFMNIPANSVIMDLCAVENNSGMHTDVPIHGIHINEAIGQSVPVKVKATFKKNGVEIGASNWITLSSVTENGQPSCWIDLKNLDGIDGARLNLGLLPNAFSNGFIISTGNDKKHDMKLDSLIGNSDGKQTITFDIDIDGEPFSVTYKYYLSGATLEHAAD